MISIINSSGRSDRLLSYGGGGVPPGAPPQQPMGMPPQGGMPPYPAAPPPQKGGAGKFILLGCIGVVLITVLVGGGLCVYGISQGQEAMSGLMKLGKTEAMNMLSSDHTTEQKDRFSELYEASLITEMDRLGFINWAQQYEGVMNYFQIISADNMIIVEESEAFCEMAVQALESAGYWNE
jgi:hypothetical protein